MQKLDEMKKVKSTESTYVWHAKLLPLPNEIVLIHIYKKIFKEINHLFKKQYCLFIIV